MNSFDAAATTVMLATVHRLLVHEQHRICRWLPVIGDGELHTEHTHQHACRHDILPQDVLFCSAKSVPHHLGLHITTIPEGGYSPHTFILA